MEINAVITSSSGRVVSEVSRRQTGGRLRLVSHILGATPLTFRRDWFGPESVVVEIRDPGATSTCECGHAWIRHKRQANGAYGCSHYGCGCRDVVLPEGEGK